MGFTSSDDLINEITNNGKKVRTNFNKITTAGTTLVAGRAYDMSSMAGSPDRMSCGEILINSFAPASLFNWTPNGTGYAGGGGVFAKTSGTATTLTADSLNIAIIPGRFYRVQLTISSLTSSTVNFTLGGTIGTARPVTGTFVEVVTASTSAGFAIQAASSTGVWSVSNISVIEWGAASGTITPASQIITNTNSPSLHTGGLVTPDTKHLLSMGAMTTAATGVGQLFLVDMLMCYPYIDANSASAQTCTNNNTLPRYTDGNGVRAFMVSAGTGYVANATTVGAIAHNVAINYTRQNTGGTDTGRQMPVTVSCTSSAVSGHITHSGIAANNFFPLPLANTDTGLRTIQSITLSAASGTAGTYYHMVLYKELAMIPVPAVNVYYERDFVNMIPSLERVQDGAVLGLIYVAGAGTAASTTFLGHVEMGWG